MIKLAEQRAKRNLTQKQAAAMLEVAPSTLNQWETGIRRPNIDMVVKMAQLFDCSTDELLGYQRRPRAEGEA